MPLTYSIAYGLIAGIFSFAFLEGTFLLLTYVGIEKPNFDDAGFPKPNAPILRADASSPANIDESKIETVGITETSKSMTFDQHEVGDTGIVAMTEQAKEEI